MQPIDIRYHVVSLVAMFMALGVGIFLGSNLDFLNVKTLVSRQRLLINRLERAEDDIVTIKNLNKKERSQDLGYIKKLEENSIPLLLDGRLTGVNVGLVTVGDFPTAGIDHNVVSDMLGRADACVAFKLRLSLPSLDQMAASYKGDFDADFASEILRADTQPGGITGRLAEAGWVMEGGFERDVQAVLFVIGKNVNPEAARRRLFALEKAIAATGGSVVINAAFGGNTDTAALFKESGSPLLQHIETVPGQVELMTRLWENVRLQRERFKPDQDMKEEGVEE